MCSHPWLEGAIEVLVLFFGRNRRQSSFGRFAAWPRDLTAIQEHLLALLQINQIGSVSVRLQAEGSRTVRQDGAGEVGHDPQWRAGQALQQHPLIDAIRALAADFEGALGKKCGKRHITKGVRYCGKNPEGVFDRYCSPS